MSDILLNLNLMQGIRKRVGRVSNFAHTVAVANLKYRNSWSCHFKVPYILTIINAHPDSLSTPLKIVISSWVVDFLPRPNVLHAKSIFMQHIISIVCKKISDWE